MTLSLNQPLLQMKSLQMTTAIFDSNGFRARPTPGLSAICRHWPRLTPLFLLNQKFQSRGYLHTQSKSECQGCPPMSEYA